MENSIPVQLPSAMINDADEVPTILNTESGSIFLTNEVGLAILHLCDGERTVGQIVHAIAEKYETDCQTVLSDTQEFFKLALKEGIVKWRQTSD